MPIDNYTVHWHIHVGHRFVWRCSAGVCRDCIEPNCTQLANNWEQKLWDFVCSLITHHRRPQSIEGGKSTIQQIRASSGARSARQAGQGSGYGNWAARDAREDSFKSRGLDTFARLPSILRQRAHIHERLRCSKFFHHHHRTSTHSYTPVYLPLLEIMLFEEGDAALLKKWIVKRLEDMYVPPPPSTISSPPILHSTTVRSMILMM